MPNKDLNNLEEYDSQVMYRNEMKENELNKNNELKYGDISIVKIKKKDVDVDKKGGQQYIRPFTNVEIKKKNDIKGYIMRRNSNNQVNNHKLIRIYGTGANHKEKWRLFKVIYKISLYWIIIAIKII